MVRARCYRRLYDGFLPRVFDQASRPHAISTMDLPISSIVLSHLLLSPPLLASSLPSPSAPLPPPKTSEPCPPVPPLSPLIQEGDAPAVREGVRGGTAMDLPMGSSIAFSKEATLSVPSGVSTMDLPMGSSIAFSKEVALPGALRRSPGGLTNHWP